MIIFDCDGVLVETEMLFAQSDADLLAEQGIFVPPQELLNRYTGVLYEDMVADMIARYSGLTPEFAAEMRIRARKRLQQGVDPVPGIVDVVRQVRGTKCVASNSSLEHLNLVLGHVGLLDDFGETLYSAYMVPRPKPYPDLHLHCAAEMQVDPAQCVVVEDSATGIQAAKAAGMTAIGLTAASHMQDHAPAKLAAAGADHVIESAAELARVLTHYEAAA